MSFEGNAAVTISIPRQSGEVAEDGDVDLDTETHNIAEFNISILESTAEGSADNAQSNEEELFLHEAAKCISNDDKLWSIGLILGAVDNEITEIRTNDQKSITMSAFHMLQFCKRKKKCTWDEFRSKLRTAFERNNMANEFEKLHIELEN